MATQKSKLEITAEYLIALNICPNCWGEQAWEGKFIQYEKDRERDIINKDHSAQKAFIQKFVEEYVDGIHLLNDEHVKPCPSCGIHYSIQTITND